MASEHYGTRQIVINVYRKFPHYIGLLRSPVNAECMPTLFVCLITGVSECDEGWTGELCEKGIGHINVTGQGVCVCVKYINACDTCS